MPGLEKTTIGHYRIDSYLARGGMSEIYLAQDLRSGQVVAMKLVHGSDSHKCERFRREIKVTSLLEHEHILPVLDQGEYDSWCYMVTPFAENGTLHDRLGDGPLSFTEAGTILEQLAEALQFAHEHGIIHRDIKPANIFIGAEGHIYLADFGLVRDMHEECDQAPIGHLVGTAEYMAPELAEMEAMPQSDIYALGILLYQMLTGRVPFSGSTPIGSYLKHIREQPMPPSQFNPIIPLSVEQVILCALEKRPQCRFQTAREFALAYAEACTIASTMPRSISDQIASSSKQPPRVRARVPLRREMGEFFKTSLISAAASFLLVILPLMLGYSLALHSRPTVVAQEKITSATHGDVPISVVPVIPAILNPPGAVEVKTGKSVSIQVLTKKIPEQCSKKQKGTKKFCALKKNDHYDKWNTSKDEENLELKNYSSENSIYEAFQSLTEKNTISIEYYNTYENVYDQQQDSTSKQKKDNADKSNK